MISFLFFLFLENSASNEQNSSVTAPVDCHPCEKPSCSGKLPQKGIQEYPATVIT